ncbi:MAG: hypothetical protein KAR20_19020, partial [Candidatus Heimdallarchaeota archaeon]|nr:hypothetical protein [Candidatus Heimdallarchaeota archaeon]
MKIIIDSPGIQKDCMDFEKYASMFSKIVEESPPRFTIGIFGEWGSGKTTLMNMIYDLLEKNDQFVPIKFNAWRYERDKHLMIPLLETIRLKLDHLAKENEEEKQKVKQISNVIKAIAKGFEGEFSFNIPLAAKAKIKLNPKEWFKKEDEQ